MPKKLTDDDLAYDVMESRREHALAQATLDEGKGHTCFTATWRGELLAEFAVARMGQGDTRKVLTALANCASEAAQLAMMEAAP